MEQSQSKQQSRQPQILRHTFQSRHLNQAEYDPASQVLTIQFVNGALYQYHGVPRTKADILFQTGSSQDYFNDSIKGVYRFTRLSAGRTKTGRRSTRRI
jgi:KTSC domain